MYTNAEVRELHDRIRAGIKAANKKLIEDYKASNDTLVVMRNGKIEYINPFDLDLPDNDTKITR